MKREIVNCSECGNSTYSQYGICRKTVKCRLIYFAAYQKRNRMKYSYGLSKDDITTMLELQDGKCALSFCDTILTPENTHVDHDHATGKPRGLLCRRHNNGLGFFNDDPAMLRAAADYLESTMIATT